MSDVDTNPPPAGVTDMESAVRSLVQPEEAKEHDEPEAAQEPQDEAETEVVEAEDAEGDEPEASEDAEDGADDSEEETEEPRYTVKVNGEEYEVNLSELRDGYQRQADYTRKSSEVADEKRQLQQHAEQIEQMRGQLAAEYERIAAVGQESEPDWGKLAKELDPWDYQQQRADWEGKQRQRAEAFQRAQAMRAQQSQKAIVENAKHLLERVPEWNDPQKFEAERAELQQVARSYGFSDQDFMSAVDYRAFLMLRDAAYGRKMREQKAPVAKRKPKPAPTSLKPGAKATRSEHKAKEQDALRKNLRERKDVESAVKWIMGG